VTDTQSLDGDAMNADRSIAGTPSPRR
jgi:hypothetical protein